MSRSNPKNRRPVSGVLPVGTGSRIHNPAGGSDASGRIPIPVVPTPKDPITGTGSTGYAGGDIINIPGTPINNFLNQPREDDSHGIKIQELFKALTSGNTNAYQLLASLLAAGDGNFSDEQWDQIFEYVLSLNNTTDQRNYDWKMLQESRNYNTPLNELARLMGAGISRDAAIQKLLGGSASGSVAGSVIGSGSSQLVAPSVPQTSGTQDLQKIQTGISGAVEILSAIGQLMGAGVSFAQGVEQVKAMQYQNTMNQETLDSYQSVNEITKAIQGMQLTGILEPADIDSMQNANDVYKWLLDHADTNAVKPIVQSGAFQRAFGSTIGREMFNRNWHQMRDSRDYGTQLDQLIRSNELKNDLLRMDVQQSYVDLSTMFVNLERQYPQLLSDWENYYQEIEATKQAEYTTDLASLQSYESDIRKRALVRIYEDKSKGGIGSASERTTGLDLFSFDEWYSLRQACANSMAKYDMGDQFWNEYFQNNVKTAAALNYLRMNQSVLLKNTLDPNGPNPGFAVILNIIKTITDAGAWDAIDAVCKPAQLGLNAFRTFDPVKPR